MTPAASARGRRDEAGVATVWGIAWMSVIVLVAWLAGLAGFVAASQHHLDAAADLVALSAADALQHGGEPCPTAARVAAANHASLAGCDVQGADVVVLVQRSVHIGFGWSPRIGSTARAGPTAELG